MLCSVYLTKHAEMTNMERITDTLAWAWGWIWYGWTSLIDWDTQMGLAQMGITIRETGDIVDYVSGMIGIIGAAVAVWHFVFRRRAGSKEQQGAFFRNSINLLRHLSCTHTASMLPIWRWRMRPFCS
jgi:hypothetical protein